jgi:hypothetical protein
MSRRGVGSFASLLVAVSLAACTGGSGASGPAPASSGTPGATATVWPVDRVTVLLDLLTGTWARSNLHVVTVVVHNGTPKAVSGEAALDVADSIFRMARVERRAAAGWLPATRVPLAVDARGDSRGGRWRLGAVVVTAGQTLRIPARVTLQTRGGDDSDRFMDSDQGQPLPLTGRVGSFTSETVHVHYAGLHIVNVAPKSGCAIDAPTTTSCQFTVTVENPADDPVADAGLAGAAAHEAAGGSRDYVCLKVGPVCDELEIDGPQGWVRTDDQRFTPIVLGTIAARHSMTTRVRVTLTHAADATNRGLARLFPSVGADPHNIVNSTVDVNYGSRGYGIFSY